MFGRRLLEGSWEIAETLLGDCREIVGRLFYICTKMYSDVFGRLLGAPGRFVGAPLLFCDVPKQLGDLWRLLGGFWEAPAGGCSEIVGRSLGGCEASGKSLGGSSSVLLGNQLKFLGGHRVAAGTPLGVARRLLEITGVFLRGL